MTVTAERLVNLSPVTHHKESTHREQKSMLLLRCPYPYGRSQTWMPMDLIKVGAKLDNVGVPTTMLDLNLSTLPFDLNKFTHVGIGVIGSPYIPISRELANTVSKLTGKKVIIGGQGTEHLSEEEFRTIYGATAIQIRSDLDLQTALGLNIAIPNVHVSPIGGQINLIDPAIMQRYLSSEFSFFVSQGCKHACDFCAAERTRGGIRVTERFSQTIREDLDAICEKANTHGIRRMEMYLTPLDAFQNPKQIKDALKLFSEAASEHKTEFRLRVLSRIDSFLNALKTEPELKEIIYASGLKTIGFGVDGTSEHEWRSQHKGIRNLSEADIAFKECTKLGVIPEALLVMGFHDSKGMPVGDKASIMRNFDFALSRAEEFGVVARPHVAKEAVPGNNGWKNPVWSKQREMLLRDPKLFKNLDFVALASELTHPNTAFRDAVNETYIKIIETLTPAGLCATNLLLPYSSVPGWNELADEYNRLVRIDR